MPAAATTRVTLPPLLMGLDSGSLVMAGGELTVTVAVPEFATPAALLLRTQ